MQSTGYWLKRGRNALWRFTPLGPRDYRRFRRQSRQILGRRERQTEQEVAELSRKYAAPIFGTVSVYELLLRMRDVTDPTDTELGNTDQLKHTLQVLDSMDDAGVRDEDMRLAAVLHDLGKLLYLTGEAPENVFGMKSPIGDAAPGVGLDNVPFQWNHDDFVYTRFKDHVPDPVAWLLRYHSIYPEACRRFMDARDLDYARRYLRDFQVHDLGSKSVFRSPWRRLDDYRPWIQARFPDPLPF